MSFVNSYEQLLSDPDFQALTLEKKSKAKVLYFQDHPEEVKKKENIITKLASILPDMSKKSFPATAEAIETMKWNPLNLPQGTAKEFGKKVYEESIGQIVNAALNENESVKQAISKAKTPQEKTAQVLNALASTGNLLFSPLSAAFGAAQNIPVVGKVVRALNVPMAAISDYGGNVLQETVKALPITEQAKQEISPAARNVGSVLSQLLIAAGIAKSIPKKPPMLKPLPEPIKEGEISEQPQISPETAPVGVGQGVKPEVSSTGLKTAYELINSDKMQAKPIEPVKIFPAEKNMIIQQELGLKYPESKTTIGELVQRLPEKPIESELQNAVGMIKSAGKEIKDVIIPTKMEKPNIVAREQFRENLGKIARENTMMEEGIRSAEKEFDKMPIESQYELMDHAENGRLNDEGITYKFGKPAVDTMKELNDVVLQEYKKVSKSIEDAGDIGSGYVQNYIPHFWEKRGGTDIPLNGKKTLEGKPTFKNPRTFRTIREGLEQGYVPKYSNPATMAKMKILEYRKYRVALDTIEGLKKDGLVKVLEKGEIIPDGWTKIEGTNLNKSICAPEEVARIFKNYLSKGLSGSKLFQVWRGAGNAMNQFQLGVSAFHVGFTTVDAMISKFAIGLRYLMSGKGKEAFRSFAQTPTAGISNIVQGSKLLKEYLGKGSDPAYTEIANLLASAGGRVKMDSFYSTKISNRMIDLFKQKKYISGALRAPLELVETIAKPIMEFIVPRQKLGVFTDMVKYEKETHPNITPEQLKTAVQKAWDSVDNRMGQMVYDNLFWDKTFKDALMASVRSVGWNLGTIREVGGGIIDFAKVGKNIFTKQKPEFTHRMAYIIALPIVSGIMGAMYQFLRTGKAPESVKDLYFPQTGKINMQGEKERVSLPTYMKDLYHYSKAPGKTIMNKAHPMLGTISDMLNNKDFYGVEIRHIDDPFVTQIGEGMGYLGKQIVPFGIRNAINQVGIDTPSKIQSFIGIVPAPYDLNLTKLDEKIQEIKDRKMPQGSRTIEQFKHSQLMKSITMHKINNPEKYKEELKKNINTGKLSSDDIKKIAMYNPRNKNMTLRDRVKTFSMDEISELIKVASPEEKKILIPIALTKGIGQIQSKATGPDERTQSVDKFKSLIEINNKLSPANNKWIANRKAQEKVLNQIQAR